MDKNFTPLKLLPKTTGTTLKPSESNGKAIEVQQKPDHIIDQYQDIRHKRVFKLLLKKIKERKLGTSVVMAKALGITKDTYIRYLNMPEAMKLLSDNVDYVMNNMIEAGKGDWKMWKDLKDDIAHYDKQDNTTNIQVNTLDGLTIIRR